MRPVELVLERLGDYEQRNGSCMASCPAHEDSEPSLSVREGDDGRVLLHCFAGCSTPKIIAALGLEMGDLFSRSTNGHRNGLRKASNALTAVYEVRNAAGELQAEHVRYDRPGGGKDCMWRLPGASGWGLNGRKLSTLPLYRSELLREWPENVPGIVVEGEKPAAALAKVYPAVLGTVTGASGTPGPEALEVLRGRRVVLWPDNDEEGRRHMARIAEALCNGIAAEVRVFEWPEAPPKGDAADHPTVLSRSRDAVEELLAEMAAGAVWKSESSSSASLAYKGDYDDDDTPAMVWFSAMGAPKPREFLVEDLVPAGYATTIYGTGGVAKSYLAMKLGIACAGGLEEWLGLKVNSCGPVLYLDFELDADEQVRRVRDLCAGLNAAVPRELGYFSALGLRTPEAFAAALQLCRREGVRLLILDSLGPAMLGDAERARDVIAFHNDYLAPFREAGVTVLIVDHQGKLQAGEKYQDKGALGSAYKSHLSRSTIQVELVRRDRDAETLTVRMRHTKTNFGPLREPWNVEISFGPGRVITRNVELDATELAGESTLNADDRVLMALADGPAFPDELAEATGLVVGTVKNCLTRLRKRGDIEDTDQAKGRARQVRLSSSSSLPL